MIQSINNKNYLRINNFAVKILAENEVIYVDATRDYQRNFGFSD
jgi:hypothetical protein